MNARTPLLGAVALVLVALLFAYWSTGNESASTAPRGLAPQSEGQGELKNDRVSLLKDRPLPGQAQPPDPAKPGEPPSGGANASETPVLTQSEAQATKRALRRQIRADAAARRTAIAGGDPQARASEQDVEVEGEDYAGGGGFPEEPVPTFEPGSIYDGLSQDDLVEIMVALRRLRDAGVFHTLTPDQYYQVQQLMPDRQGIRDADRITQEILGMSVGEWLAHERGPKGRFSLQ